MVERNAPAPMRLRTVFISDIHLGFKGCSADLLLDFLHNVEMDTCSWSATSSTSGA